MTAPTLASHRAHARVGALLNEKWRLDALLGIGGMAAVYGASHRNGKRAAIKILHPELGADATLVARFLREGYLANRVEHPGVVSVLDDARAEDGSPYLVMELLDGYSLEKHTQTSPMPLADVLRVADELLDVLASAHATGIVHRDIKPANLFLTRDGKVKVLDFGIARLAEPSGDGGFTQTGAAIGTPSYMPPEQARGRWSEVDARTDLWAVGATMLALLVGHRPRRAETVQEELLLAMTQPMAPAASLYPSLPPRIAAAIDAALAFDRDRRFPDARAMQLELRRAADAGDAQLDGRTLIVSSPTVDTARVVHPGMAAMAMHGPAVVMPPPAPPSSSTLEMAEPQLTTGRPMWVAPPATLPPQVRGRGALVAVLASVLLVAVLGGGGAVAWKKHRVTSAARAADARAADARAARGAASSASPAAAPLPAPAPPEAEGLPGVATAAGLPPVTAGGETPVAAPPSSAPPSSAATAATAATAASAVSSGTPRVAAPRAPAGPRGSAAPADTSDMFNRRF